MKRLLVISPYFPPSTLAGVHRARLLAKHLPAFGWKPIVLCVDERHHDEKIDPELATLLPTDLEIVKTGALPSQLTRFAGVGDLSLRAFHHLKAAVRAILDKELIDAVFITGSPYYPMLFSRWLKTEYAKPVVLDFQDPWVSAYGAAQSPFSKGGLAHRLSTHLEPMALRHADFVASVSVVQNEEMAQRYSWLDAKKMAAIPIGGDPDDYDVLRGRPRVGSAHILSSSHINFSYVGTFLPRSDVTARVVFAALARLRETTPRLAARVRLNFVGSSNQPNDAKNFRFMPLAAAAGVADLVNEMPQRVPYLDALSVLANSQAVLLLGSDEPHYTASKIYPGLMSGRPFLSLFHNASSAHHILAKAGGGYAFSFMTTEELEAHQPRIASAMSMLATESGAVGQPRASAIEPYTAAAIARRFAAIFDSVAS
ncbi:MAG TPA: glycosyltransferase [Xanthobacteraceae bacterium]|jgi:hypothetical protein|nr:glycosyltransferase [Xanthobacteraceae bacterium]